MGQKVHPAGMRIGINKDWQSKWFAEKKDFSKLLKADIEIRRYLEKRLNEIFKYNKKSYSFEELEPRIVDAIEREAKYEESIEGLKTNLGTNVGKLVKKIMEVK